ncbi:MAG: hypothetical protein P4L56_19615 [Candidatus Sulfopaludibacter sp.]|nr:hypothetical protein [Candidatus Sulfopaludibacter sp.]
MSPEQTEQPNTVEPKPRDKRAFNAYRHGLTGHVLVIAPSDEQPYKDHCLSIHQYWAPVGGMEVDLVQQIADDRWRLKRACAMESAVVVRGLNQPDDAQSGNEQVDVALAMGRVWGEQKKDLNLLSLYESRIQRRIEKNIALIRQLQQDRRAILDQIVEEAAILGETYDFPPEALPPNFVYSAPQIQRLAAHRRRLEAVRKPTRRAA